MANVDIQLGYKDSAWFTSNATLVLLAGQSVHLLQTGTYKIGDGTTQLSALSFLGAGAGFVPYTGATSDLHLGSNNLTADHIALNVSPSGAGYVVGATQWNNTIGSSETLLKGGNVSLKNGVDLVARVVNKVVPNTTLTKAAYQVVKVSGASGQKLAVDLAQANIDLNSADTIGVVTETITTNQEGFIMTVGQILDINTTGSLQGETWADGDVLYLSPTTAGIITKVKPNGLTGHIVVVGYVEYAHATQGKIYVKIMNGWELDELHNVYINPTTLANNDLLQYESATSLWKNKPFTFIPNVQSVTSAATVTPTTLNDEVVVTAQAVALALANPTGTALQGESLIIRIKDNGTARAITYDTQYRAIGVTLPTTTVISKTVYLGFIYNSTDTKWDCIGVSQQA